MDMKGIDVIVDGETDDTAMNQVLTAASTAATDPQQFVHSAGSIEAIQAGTDITTVGLRMIGDVELGRDQRASLRKVDRGEKIDLTARLLTPGAALRIVHT